MNAETNTAAAAAPAFATPQRTYNSAPALEIRELGGGARITQKQMLEELAQLNAGVSEGQLPNWRLETTHELFALRSPLTHKNSHGAHSYDESIQDDWYWTDEETPWCEGGRVVVGFNYGYVSDYDDGDRARARAVRVSGQ